MNRRTHEEHVLASPNQDHRQREQDLTMVTTGILRGRDDLEDQKLTKRGCRGSLRMRKTRSQEKISAIVWADTWTPHTLTIMTALITAAGTMIQAVKIFYTKTTRNWPRSGRSTAKRKMRTTTIRRNYILYII